jgi:chloride channel protein, CIC family
MIGFFTNLFYYHRLSVQLVSPALNTLGVVAIVIPVVGGLIVGIMARFGSEQIGGHGIPEAMERILINGSKVQLRLAIFKPICRLRHNPGNHVAVHRHRLRLRADA